MRDISDTAEVSQNQSALQFSKPAYKMTNKLRKALKKASGDFRSDVVTVPTEATMQVY